MQRNKVTRGLLGAIIGGTNFRFHICPRLDARNAGAMAKWLIILLGNMGFDGAALVDKMHTS